MEAVSTGAATITILSALSQAPVIFTILVLVIGPWIMSIFIAWISNRNQERRFREVEAMYTNNVRLVEDYDKICAGLTRVAEEQTGYMMSNTAALTALTDKIATNQFCPMARVRAKAEGEA